MPKYDVKVVESTDIDKYYQALRLFVNGLVKKGVKPGNITRTPSHYSVNGRTMYATQVDWWVA